MHLQQPIRLSREIPTSLGRVVLNVAACSSVARRIDPPPLAFLVHARMQLISVQILVNAVFLVLLGALWCDMISPVIVSVGVDDGGVRQHPSMRRLL